LTCGHVVRVGGYGLGPVAKEIVCWHPEFGYKRTKHGNRAKMQGRLKNKMDGGLRARVSSCSPYNGRLDSLPDTDFAPHKDWVLLEVEDEEGRNKFDIEPTVERIEEAEHGKETYFVGYPGGAGWKTMASQWFGHHLLEDGKPPQAKKSGNHVVADVKDKLVYYHGRVDARPGMSGGGVFHAMDGSLIGLHRSRDDAALEAHAISVNDILEWLDTEYKMVPVFKKRRHPRPSRWLLGGVLGIIGIVAASILSLKCRSPEYVWRGVVQEIVIEDGIEQRRPVDGAIVIPHLKRDYNMLLKVVTPSPKELGVGEFEIRTREPNYFSEDAELEISKDGYETVKRRAQAVTPLKNGEHRRIYTLIKKSTQ
ncbi:MAG: trypsin-like peptidase domain-containing protein, partial [Luteolibacter sp.]